MASLINRTVASAVIWRGPSLLNGEPIVVIVTGLVAGSRNTKTGKMPQVWILTEKHPVEAVHDGSDEAICGDCSMRADKDGKGRKCYVTLIHGPRIVWESWQRGIYPEMTTEAVAPLLGERVRFGAYGDGAAVPVAVWKALAEGRRVNAYTQQWMRAPELKPWFMASCTDEAEAECAQAMGWRTFRVRREGEQLMMGEKQCPSAAESLAVKKDGSKLTCADCMGCGGATGHGPQGWSIAAHGAGAVHFT